MKQIFDTETVTRIFDQQAYTMCDHTVNTVYGAAPAAMIAMASYEVLETVAQTPVLA